MSLEWTYWLVAAPDAASSTWAAPESPAAGRAADETASKRWEDGWEVVDIVFDETAVEIVEDIAALEMVDGWALLQN